MFDRLQEGVFDYVNRKKLTEIPENIALNAADVRVIRIFYTGIKQLCNPLRGSRYR